MPAPRTLRAGGLAALVTAAVAVAWWAWPAQHGPAPKGAAPAAAASAPSLAAQGDAVMASLAQGLAAHRQIIALLAGETGAAISLESHAVRKVGHGLFHAQLAAAPALQAQVQRLVADDQPSGYTQTQRLLTHIESAPGLFDADRLAFRDVLLALQDALRAHSSLPAVKLHQRVSDDLEALSTIEQNYEKELGAIYMALEATRAINLKREKWDAYVAHVQRLHPREAVLKAHGVVLAYSPAELARRDTREIETPSWLSALPPKTLVLTFDDGPHPRYTDEIKVILRQYGAPAVFFQVGRNLGSIKPDGSTVLGAQASIARALSRDGFTLANHSFSHAQLSKTAGEQLKGEILHTDALLKAVDPQRAPLFRFPYGAQSREGLGYLGEAGLLDVGWHIDSLDWADPVPSSIAERVLRGVAQSGKGIVLFHDIHERTVKALPLVLDRLVAEGYQFAGWDGRAFSLNRGAEAGEASAARAQLTTGYRNSWAVVVGIDQYTQYPKLQRAVADAKAVSQALQQRFGFAPERTVTLFNEAATRQGILAALHKLHAHGGLHKDDRVFIYFAGHGATTKLPNGRELGYVLPVDADPEQLARDGISMTELQAVAQSLPAKHLLFVMDSCYSGLGLTRAGGGGKGFLKQNAQRVGRQMLTAGGADQLVSDEGPDGHSVFTWTLLQALAGKGDLNGDGFITGTELAAYIAPAVAAVSQQTPAFGSLQGSQGGELVFELPVETEFLSADAAQLQPEALALVQRQAKAAAAAPDAAIVVPDLAGQARTLAPLPTVGLSVRQQAQRANDRGLQAFRAQRYAEAEAAFTEALKLRPDFALAANNLGFVYFKQNKPAEAARWFQNTLQLDPSRAVAYLNLGDAQRALGQAEAARKAYTTYLELAPTGAGVAQARAALAAL
jgi:peptidoglycan/xylan/chitin deacetylase (PgdA/CDA1 family)/uncharacterized caspase-like protein